MISLWILCQYSLCKFGASLRVLESLSLISICICNCARLSFTARSWTPFFPPTLWCVWVHQDERLAGNLFPFISWMGMECILVGVIARSTLQSTLQIFNLSTALKNCLQNIICNDIMPYFYLFLYLLKWFYNHQSLFKHFSDFPYFGLVVRSKDSVTKETE